MATIKSFTSLEQSKKLAEILPLESADMVYIKHSSSDNPTWEFNEDFPPMILGNVPINEMTVEALPCWSLVALLKLMPKHILRKDKIHYGQTFIPSFRWEISPTAIYYTDGNNIMDYVSFRYGENNIELIDAVFKMAVWLKEKGLL